MALKAVVDKIEDVAEPLRGFYTPGEDGKFVLDAEGVPDVSKLTNALNTEREAVEQTRKQLKTLEGQLKTFDGIDPKAYKEWATRQDTDEEMKLMTAGKKEELKSRWVSKMQEAHADAIAKMEKEFKAQLEKERARSQKFEGRVLENALLSATLDVDGFHKPATRDWVNFAKQSFVLDEDGRAIMKRDDGTTVFGRDPKVPYSPKEFLEDQRKDSPHWFAASGSGTGAPTGTRGNKGTGPLTMTRADFTRLNPQKQKDFVLKEKGIVVDS